PRLLPAPQAPGSQQLAFSALDRPPGAVGPPPTTAPPRSGPNNGCAILIEEVSGLATGSTTAACFDGTAGTSSGTLVSGANTVTLGAYSSTAASEFLIIAYDDDGDTTGNTVTTPSGYTADANNVTGSSNDTLTVFYKNSTA